MVFLRQFVISSSSVEFSFLINFLNITKLNQIPNHESRQTTLIYFSFPHGHFVHVFILQFPDGFESTPARNFPNKRINTESVHDISMKIEYAATNDDPEPFGKF